MLSTADFELDAMTGTPAPRRLPFAFARRHGVLLLEGTDGLRLGLRQGASLTALQEAQRIAGMPLALEWLATRRLAPATEAGRQ